MAKTESADKIFSNLIFTEKKTGGFLMVEVLFALFIITAGLVVVLALYSKTAVNANQDRDAVIGALLAQEGVEIARNIRDNNWAAGTTAFGANFPPSSSNNCNVGVAAGMAVLAGTDTAIDCSGKLGLYLNYLNT